MKCRITLPSDVVTQELDRLYLELQRRVKIRGFRKAPRSILKRRFGKEIEKKAIEKLIKDTCFDTLEKQGLNNIEILGLENIEIQNSRLEYTVIYEICLEITHRDLLGLEAKVRNSLGTSLVMDFSTEAKFDLREPRMTQSSSAPIKK